MKLMFLFPFLQSVVPLLFVTQSRSASDNDLVVVVVVTVIGRLILGTESTPNSGYEKGCLPSPFLCCSALAAWVDVFRVH